MRFACFSCTSDLCRFIVTSINTIYFIYICNMNYSPRKNHKKWIWYNDSSDPFLVLWLRGSFLSTPLLNPQKPIKGTFSTSLHLYFASCFDVYLRNLIFLWHLFFRKKDPITVIFLNKMSYQVTIIGNAWAINNW